MAHTLLARKVAWHLLAAGALAACATTQPPPEVNTAPPLDVTSVEVTREDPPPPAPPSPEELARARAVEALAAERAEMHKQHEADVARFTPELTAKVKTLAEKPYPNGRAALKAVLASEHRSEQNRARDAARHPLETLTFAGFQPKQTVLEYGPGQGWYTEILAPALAAQGKLLVTNGNPNGPQEVRSTFYAERVKLLLETSPELYGKVETVTVEDKNPALGHAGSVDLALVFRGLHGMVNQGTLDAWLAALHEALKPKGTLVIEQHRAKPDADAAESAKKGYLPEAWVISKIEAAGFKLAGKSEINKNPRDTKDYAEGVWALPPSYGAGDTDRAKYTAIGESDRMTLKFVKVEPRKIKSEAKAGTLPKADASAGAAGALPTDNKLAPSAAPEAPAVPQPAAPSAPAEPAKEKL